MKKTILIFVMTALFCMALNPVIASAAEPRYEMKSEAVIKDILSENINKRVIVRLETGENLEGFVSRVGDSLVHLSKITGRDFFDAVVRIDRINAVVFRVREK
jgi:hypothetical protein